MLTAVDYYGTGEYQLTFTPPSIGGGATVTDYYYQGSCDGGTTYNYGGDAATASSPAVVSGACPNETFEIEALVNGEWLTPLSNSVTAAALTPPTLDSAAFDGEEGVLSVTPPAPADGETVTDYVWELSCDGGATYITGGDAGSASGVFDAGYCGAGATSTYTVIAIINGAWETPTSNTASFYVPPPPPPPDD